MDIWWRLEQCDDIWCVVGPVKKRPASDVEVILWLRCKRQEERLRVVRERVEWLLAALEDQ